MEEVKTGVNPGYDMDFGICTSGRPEDLENAEYTTVKDTEGLEPSIDGKMEEWSPLDQYGWTRNLITGKAISMPMVSKRNYGDPGNDYVASLMLKSGQDCNSAVKITFPNKDALIIPCVINVTKVGAVATGIEGIEWEVKSDGKPIYVAYQTV